jgi:hypothetical protein
LPRVRVPVSERGGKPTSTAAAGEEGAREHNGSELLLGTVDSVPGGVSLCDSVQAGLFVLMRALVAGILGEGAGGAGAGATECGVGSPVSAHEPRDAVEAGGRRQCRCRPVLNLLPLL